MAYLNTVHVDESIDRLTFYGMWLIWVPAPWAIPALMDCLS